MYDWLIDWIEFYAVSAISALQRYMYVIDAKLKMKPTLLNVNEIFNHILW